MSNIRIMFGDNIESLKTLPDNSLDSAVIDAPYGLGEEPDPVAMIQAWVTTGYLEVKGTGFMGQKWDAFVPQPIFWKEVFRVLKPGAHLLCFFGTRTYDWGTLSIRLAGFEIRDMITWHYGSGFPKSLNIEKALAKIDYYNVRQYKGWGTYLKPATEPICMARKPIVDTVATNVSIYSTGGINIDACRIGFESEADKQSAIFGRGTDILGGNYVGAKHSSGKTNIAPDDNGRFPANVIFDEYTAELLDVQSGTLTSGKPSGKRNAGNKSVYSAASNIGSDVTGYGDTGGASRFFYCAKASQGERNAGCDHLIKQASGFKIASGRGIQRGDAYKDMQAPNFHPTIKPISLMRWLIKLVTPLGGITLDTHAGSGTTGCAAALEGFDIILMEAEEKYIPIIEARTQHWQKVAEREQRAQALKDSVQSLF